MLIGLPPLKMHLFHNIFVVFFGAKGRIKNVKMSIAYVNATFKYAR